MDRSLGAWARVISKVMRSRHRSPILGGFASVWVTWVMPRLAGCQRDRPRSRCAPRPSGRVRHLPPARAIPGTTGSFRPSLITRPHTGRSLAPRLLAAGPGCAEAPRIEGIEKTIHPQAQRNPELAYLMTMPGPGAGAGAVSASCPSTEQFGSGVAFIARADGTTTTTVAARAGLVPTQNATGRRTRLDRISQKRLCGVRRLTIIGASALICRAARTGPPQRRWPERRMPRMPHRPVAVALANRWCGRSGRAPSDRRSIRRRQRPSDQASDTAAATPECADWATRGLRQRSKKPDRATLDNARRRARANPIGARSAHSHSGPRQVERRVARPDTRPPVAARLSPHQRPPA